MNSCVVGVDIGGSHVTAAVIDVEKRTMLEQSLSRRMVDSNAPMNEVLSDWAAAIRECISTGTDSGLRIGVAMPGPFDYANGISYIKGQNKFESLYGVYVKEALATELAIEPSCIQFENDAASFLRGEAFGGVAQNHQSVLGFTLGTGLGSAIYQYGESTDANLWCSPFKSGIAEDYFSSRWFVQRYREKTSRSIANVKELSALYQEDFQVREIFAEFGENLGLFLRPLIQIHQPELVVFAGNISKSSAYFFPSLENYLEKSGTGRIVKKSRLGEYAALIGAASHWINESIII